jgi:manganese transport protein
MGGEGWSWAGVAIVPVVIVAWIYGESGTAQMLVLSQVVLSLQLPFAVVPLVRFTTDRRLMGELVAPRWVAVLAWVVTAVIISLNAKLLFDVATGA